MPFNVSVKRHLGIIELHLFGGSQDDDYNRIRRYFLKKSRENNAQKILVDLFDLQIKDSASTVQLFDFGRTLRKPSSFSRLRVACVLPREELSRKDVLFAANLSRIRGQINMNLFFNSKEALRWLAN